MTHGVTIAGDVAILPDTTRRSAGKPLAEQRPDRLERRLVISDQVEFGAIASREQHAAAGTGGHHTGERARHLVGTVDEPFPYVERCGAMIHAQDLDPHLRMTRHRKRSAPGCVCLSAT